MVQSTDKNFMVPVGGAIILAPSTMILRIEKMYPGRAGISPVLDLFVTFLSMGKTGYKHLLEQRKENFQYFKQRLKSLEGNLPIKVLDTPKNDISIAIQIIMALLPRILLLWGSFLFVRTIRSTTAYRIT